MKTKKLGRQGPDVSAVCLGAWPIGGGMGTLVESQIVKTVHAALDAGVNFIDTAEGYRESERSLGRALKGRRSKVVLATKLSGDHDLDHLNRAIENSLRNLDTDYIDLYQLHAPRFDYPIEQTMNALLRLKEQGKIRYIGVSNFSADEHAQALRYAHLDSSQPRYSMLVRDVEKEVLPFCLKNGIGVIPHSALAKGILTGKYGPNHSFAADDERGTMAAFEADVLTEAVPKVAQLSQWAEAHGHTLVHLAIAWTLAQPAVTSTIVGAKTPEQAIHNAQGGEWELTRSQLGEVNDILGTYGIVGKLFSPNSRENRGG